MYQAVRCRDVFAYIAPWRALLGISDGYIIDWDLAWFYILKFDFNLQIINCTRLIVSKTVMVWNKNNNKEFTTWPSSFLLLNYLAQKKPDRNPIAGNEDGNWIYHVGLVTPHGYIELGQHWLRDWLVAWRHQTITWANIDFSQVRFCGILMRAISQRVPKLLFCVMGLKFMLSKLLLHLPGANELSI